jgi:hypothetical protein
MTTGSVIKFNIPKLFSELQLIALLAAGETRKNTTVKDNILKEAFINNLTTNEYVLLRNGKKYSTARRDKIITIKMIAGII